MRNMTWDRILRPIAYCLDCGCRLAIHDPYKAFEVVDARQASWPQIGWACRRCAE